MKTEPNDITCAPVLKQESNDDNIIKSIKIELTKANELIRVKDARIRKMETSIQYIIESRDYISDHMMKALLTDILTEKS